MSINLWTPDNEPVNVDDDVAPDLIGQGYRVATPEEVDAVVAQTPALPTSGLVNLWSPNQEAVNADAQDVESLLADGYTLASNEDVNAQAQNEFYGTLDQQVATAGEAALQGASMGAYGYLADQVAPGYAEEMAARKQANPTTATVGELAGAVAPALLSGGTSAVATAARLTPVGRLAQLSTRVGAHFAEKAGVSALGRIATTGAIAGVEGAIDNATRRVMDDLTRGDVEISAERMLEAAWDGAKYSAVLGAGVGALGEGVSALSRKRSLSALEQADEVSEAAAKLDEAVVQGRPRADIELDLDDAQKALAEADAIGDEARIQDIESRVAKLSEEHEGAIARDMGLATESQIELALTIKDPEVAQGWWAKRKAVLGAIKNAKDLENRLDDAVDAEVRSITQDLDDLQRLKQNRLDPIFNRSNKPKAIKAALEVEGTQWTSTKAERILKENAQLKSALEELRKDYPLGDEVARRKLGPLKSALEALDGQTKYLTDLKSQGPIAPDSKILRGDLDSVAKVYWAEDNLKSYLGQIAQKKGVTVTQAEAVIQRIYMKKRASLQDANLWGSSLSEMQTVTNAAESQAIPAFRAFNAQFGRAKNLLGEHAGEHGFEELMELDPKSIKSLLKGLAESDSYKDEADFVRGLMRNIELAEAKAKYYPTSPEVLTEIAQARKVTEDLVGKVREIKLLKSQKMAAQKLARENRGLEALYAGLDAAASYAGLSLVGKLVTPAVKLAASTASLASGAVTSERGVGRAVNNAIKALTDNVKVPPVGGLGITANQIRRALEDAEALQDPKSPQSMALRLQLQDLEAESPELAQAVRDKVISKAQFLLEKRGPTVDNSDPMGPRKASQDRIREVRTARYVDAARNPQAALDRVATGKGFPEDLETLKALYPAQYRDFGLRAIEKAKKLKAPLGIRQRQQLHRATGMPTLAEHDPLKFGFAQSVAAQQAQPKEQPEPRRGSPAKRLDPDALMAKSDAMLTDD